jgi:NAD(P)-dependent dehydrogenase (short-subunit alcohol dehydrogenase family)
MGWTTDDMGDQSGRTALITGASSGLGLCSAQALAARGGRVVLACRGKAKGQAALEQVKEAAQGPEPTLVLLDLADLGSVREAAAEVRDQVERLDALMNNAGVMAIPQAVTAEGFEMQLGTNHLGHFALTGLLLETLHRAYAPRVVTTSSNAHRAGKMRWDDLDFDQRYRKWAAYGQSKLANLLYTRELDRRAREAGSDLVAVAAHPGYAATHLQLAGPELSGKGVRAGLTRRLMQVGNRLVAQSAEMGALPQLYAATQPGVQGGEYFGPDRLFQTRGHPQRVGPSRRARDDEAAARLWEISEERTGVTYEWPSAS